MPLTRLIGRKSLRSTTPEIFGMREMKVAFRFLSNLPQVMEDLHNPLLKYPTKLNLEERRRVTVRARGLIIVHSFHHLQNLPILRLSLQPIGLNLPNRVKKGCPTEAAN